MSTPNLTDISPTIWSIFHLLISSSLLSAELSFNLELPHSNNISIYEKLNKAFLFIKIGEWCTKIKAKQMNSRLKVKIAMS